MKKLDIKKMSIKDKVEFIRKNDKDFYNTLRDHDERINSRRDFISHGLMGATSLALGMTFPFSNKAMAACADPAAAAGANQPLPFLTVNGSGGPCFSKCFLPTDGNGNILPSSALIPHNLGTNLAQSTSQGTNVTRDHGHPMLTTSFLYTSMRDALGADNMQHVRAILITNRSSNDTAQDMNSLAGLIAKENSGKFSEYIGSTGAADRARSVGAPPPIIPINNGDAAAGLASAGILANRFPANNGSLEKFLNYFTNSTKKNIDTVADERMNPLLKEKIGCAIDSSKDGLLTTDDPDPRNSQEVIAAFGNNQSGSQLAAISWLIAKGYAGAGIFNVGGCDYHNQNVDTRVAVRDTELGNAFGRAARVCLELGIPLVCQYTSDGSASSRNVGTVGQRGFISPTGDDAGVCSTIIIGCFPGKKPEFRNGRTQLGSYTGDGKVSTGGVVSTKLEAQIAVLANYLALTGEEGKLQSILQAHGIANPFSNINDILVWTSIV